MKVYLDSRDLIELFEKSAPSFIDEFEQKLRRGRHELVVSYPNVIEFSAPLLQKSTQTNIMRMLNRIESMPIIYIADARIIKLELIEATRSFNSNDEYNHIAPFVDRFDETIVINGPSPTRQFLSLGLAETIFMLWTEDRSLFEGHSRHTNQLKSLFKADRVMASNPKLKDHFASVVDRHIKLYKLRLPITDVSAFSSWVYMKNTRCPAIRLGYETYHKLLRNVGDDPKKGDIPDFSHVKCLPYVDLATIDNRMANYVKQACKDMAASELAEKICKDIYEINRILDS